MKHIVVGTIELSDMISPYIDGTDQEVAAAYQKLFVNSPELFLPFKQAYRAMMSDASHTFSEKCEYCLSYPGLSEHDARGHLEAIWQLATGTKWTD